MAQSNNLTVKFYKSCPHKQHFLVTFKYEQTVDHQIDLNQKIDPNKTCDI